MSKAVIIEDQADMFLPQLVSLPIRDQRETMERPFFSLAKRKRIKPIDYVSPDGKITIHVSANSEYGIATIWDLDILIYCASLLMEHKRRRQNDIPQTLTIVPYDMLRTLKRDSSGGGYKQLINALDRLQSTTVKTNIRTTGKSANTFSWIDSHSQLTDKNGNVRGMRITLAKWFYDGVLMDGGVLAIDPAYFDITSGRERWLYRVARKHAGGAGSDGFAISMDTLFEKSGAEGDYRRFKFEISKLAHNNALPGYMLQLEPRTGAEPLLRMIKRASDQVRPAGKAKTKVKRGPFTTGNDDAPKIEFPADGMIAYTPFSLIARSALPSPQRDHQLVGKEFCNFLRSRSIDFDDANITKIFATFCSKQKSCGPGGIGATGAAG